MATLSFILFPVFFLMVLKFKWHVDSQHQAYKFETHLQSMLVKFRRSLWSVSEDWPLLDWHHVHDAPQSHALCPSSKLPVTRTWINCWKMDADSTIVSHGCSRCKSCHCRCIWFACSLLVQFSYCMSKVMYFDKLELIRNVSVRRW